MNARRLTTEQRAAMSARGVSIALASGAGCGKTTVLTEKYLSLLEGDGRLSVSRVVALTFTEKAARELRDRVRDGCRKRAGENIERAHWRGVLRGLDSARISTFHAFCSDVLKRFAIEANIDPTFAILDETLAPTYRERTLDTSTRRWLAARDPDFASLAVDYGLSTIREAIGAILEARPAMDLGEWGALEPREVLARWEAYQARATGPILLQFVERHRDLLNVLAANPSNIPQFAAGRAGLIEKLSLLPNAADPVEAIGAIREAAMVKNVGNKKQWDSEEIYEQVKLAMENLRKRCANLINLLLPDEGRSLAAAESGSRLARLAQDAIASYDQTKAEAGFLDFHDLQDRVQKLLRHGPQSVREALQSSIDALLVDEFQDTDAVQAEILESLAGEGATRGRLFLVGDAKQSIYRFRGAEPTIFQAFRERFPTEGRLDLTENFRSVPAILDFVNRLFADAFPGAGHRLRAGGAEATEPASADPPVEFLWACGPGKEDVSSRRAAEAAAVARLLASRLRDGWRVRDREAGSTRDARPGDVAILFRSRSDFPIYEQALATAGLDYHVVGGSTYFAQQEVIDLMNLLSAIEDPLDALALAGVLRGPFFGVSDEGLYWLATTGSGGLVESFADSNRVHPSMSPDDAIAVARAAETLSRWRDRKDKMPISELLDRALKESGFEAALMGEFLGERKRANVRKLVALARRFDARGSLTLADFVARLRADVRNPPREEQAATSDEAGQAIRLMTIHQAKGLEFPIVVLADLDRKSPNESKLVTHHPELGLLIRPAGDADGDATATRNLGRELADVEEARAEEKEEIRVFYVATTRARDALVLAAGRAADDPPRSAAMRQLARAFDLNTGASLADHEAGCAAIHARVLDPTALSTHYGATSARFRPKLLLTARTIQEAISAPPEPQSLAIPGRARTIDLVEASLRPPGLREADRLVRAALHDSKAAPADDPTKLIDRAAERLGMFAPRRLKTLAIDLIRRWQAMPIRQELAEAETVRRAMRWSLAWPFDDDRATVYLGRIDFARRDMKGAWHLVQVSTREQVDCDRLNLLVGAHAFEARNLGPVVSADLVTLSDPPCIERIVEFGASAIDQAVAAL